ncbi:hypothetical protein BU15DRAFT_75648 [Melanogaster broomeanus]|nr:hypothetical protein BU15DRAFT_75648 [Melanogaster broomeanus]
MRRLEDEAAMEQEHVAMRQSMEDPADLLQANSPTPPPLPEYRPSGLPARSRRLPKRFQDDLPPLPQPLPPPSPPPLSPIPAETSPDDVTPESSEPPAPSVLFGSIVTQMPPDHYGVSRTYIGPLPTHDPDNLTMLTHVSDSPHFATTPDQTGFRPWWSGFGGSLRTAREKFFEPFLSTTTFRLMCWFYSGSNLKSLGELDRLVNDVILADDFNQADLQGFRAAKEVERLDNYGADPEDVQASFSAGDGWKEVKVKIHLPGDGVPHPSVEESPFFEVPGLFYRKFIEVVKNACCEPFGSERFHLTPFSLSYTPSSNEPTEHIYSEIYNSPAMINEHEKIHSQPRVNGCTLETIIASVMLWSDSTHLTSFGTASLWPIYTYFGNQSKYIRGKPTSFAAHHLAYIPKITDALHDFYEATFKKAITADVLTHCRHELMQAIWLLLMDDDFMHAYEFGIVIEFLDDYPEKVLLASVKFLAQCPCPRCYTPKDKIGELGSQADRRRRDRDVWEDNNSIQDKINRSTFSTRLARFGVNFYSLFVPDLLHEFELGVWKAIFTHLLRVLYAHGDDAIQKLNRSNNASSMKRLAARDFEDLLQCAIPVFEHLLPSPYNEIILDLLFELATWHGLAKLRMHTDTTLGFLDTSTTRLGRFLRRFVSETEKGYVTKDLPSEEAARSQWKACKAAQGQQLLQMNPRNHQGQAQEGLKVRRFNFKTYKLHALGDYVSTIRQFGTTDNYSTQPGELEHRRAKKFYPKNFIPRLKDHLLGRLLHRQYDGDETEHSPRERNTVLLVGDQIYRHKVLRINYTTYDLRRDQDSLNPRVHSDVMVLSRENDAAHPYWYTRILGIFHAMVVHTGEHSKSSEPQRIDFLWVRWFGLDPNTYKSGWKAKRLHRIGFIPSDTPGAFGFLDPKEIIRADSVFYYVNMFVDRDMVMRYRGGGVGHRSTHEATRVLLHDRDVLDALARTTVAPSGEDDADASTPMNEESGNGRGGDEFEEDEEALEEEMEEFGYTGIEEELEGNGDGDSDDGGSSDGADEVDDELGPEDGEDDGPEEYDDYGEL